MKIEQLQHMYQIAQREFLQDGKEEYVYVSLEEKISFEVLPPQMKRIILLTEPNISAQSEVTITFGHYNPYRQPGGISFPEFYSFHIYWQRTNLPSGTKAATDGVHLSIEPTGSTLKYKIDATSRISNSRSNYQREEIFNRMIQNTPETHSLFSEYQEILAMLKLCDFQQELAEECVNFFLARK